MSDENPIPFPHIISDAPELDAPQFRFDQYAQTIADLFGNPKNKTPLGIGLYGTFGSGKTTLMKRVEHNLRNRKAPTAYRLCKTVWFRAWKYAEEEAVLAALIEEVLQTMGREESVLQWAVNETEKPLRV